MAIAGIIVLIAGLLLLSPVAGLAGADAENIGYTCDYLKWIFLGAPFIILSNGMVHIFRSTVLIRQATIAVILGNGINIVLDWVFIVRLQMGTAGAAAATSIGFLCATIYLNALAGLIGTIATQPLVETILAVICLVMYFLSCRTTTISSKEK